MFASAPKRSGRARRRSAFRRVGEYHEGGEVHRGLAHSPQQAKALLLELHAFDDLDADGAALTTGGLEVGPHGAEDGLGLRHARVHVSDVSVTCQDVARLTSATHASVCM